MTAPDSPSLVYADDGAEIWHANSLSAEHVAAVMGERKANALIVDAPYSEKTHSGHKNGIVGNRRDIKYHSWSATDVQAFVQLWAPLIGGWMVSVTDDVLASAWEVAFESSGRCRFAPIPLVETGSRVRLSGDGPSNWTCWISVARPRTREFASWGTLPGAYIQPSQRDLNSSGENERVMGGKPLRSMMAIVRDYSRPGDLVVDPCVGGGTTGQAAKSQGRRFIGIDSDIEHCELAAKKLRETKHQTAMPWAEKETA